MPGQHVTRMQCVNREMACGIATVMPDSVVMVEHVQRLLALGMMVSDDDDNGIDDGGLTFFASPDR